MAKFEYKRIELTTEESFDKAERLQAMGWKIIYTGLDSIMLERTK